jgi:O-acetyl-ADP-ribose deacetylase (regulator of RNase III)
VITYLEGDATQPIGDGPKIIAHICNDLGKWGKGFVLPLGKRFPQAKAAYLEGAKHPDFSLSEVQLVPCVTELWVANMVAQHKIRSAREPNYVAIRYDALERCLESVATHALELKATVHMPRIGTGLAGGTWEKIEPLITQKLCARGVVVTVYDFS